MTNAKDHQRRIKECSAATEEELKKLTIKKEKNAATTEGKEG